MFWIPLFKDTFKYDRNLNVQSSNEITNLEIKLKTTAFRRYSELITHEIKHEKSQLLNMSQTQANMKIQSLMENEIKISEYR